MKRLLDIVSSIIGLLLLVPMLSIIAILITIGDSGTVIFKQQRIGRYGKPFILYKFRTMTSQKDQARDTFMPGNRTRVTKIGAILRKYKLDELPQLINVLKGEMSLVGPRPEVEKWVKVYPERWKNVHTIKPGITDNASILYRDEEIQLSQSKDPENTYKDEILPRKLDLYEEYLSNQTFFGDIRIILRTIFN